MAIPHSNLLGIGFTEKSHVAPWNSNPAQLFSDELEISRQVATASIGIGGLFARCNANLNFKLGP